MLIIGLGIIPKVEQLTYHQVDYSKWLGSDFKKAKPTKSGKHSAIVCNHQSFVDVIMMLFVRRS